MYLFYLESTILLYQLRFIDILTRDNEDHENK